MSGADAGESQVAVLECVFRNHLEDLGRTIRQVLAFLGGHGIQGRAVDAVNLAVEEMATNILKYGYDDDARHRIGLRVEVQPDAIVVSFEDDGHRFDPLGAPEPELTRAAEERQPGGLGISMVRRLSRSMHYERRDGKNHLTVVVDREARRD